jgi:xanthine dehydrogenase accessory factor
LDERTALVKGGGEIGTAVALGLWHAGWRVVVCELPRPTVLRRHLSVAEAAFAGAVTREGVRVVRVATPAVAQALLARRAALPLYLGAPSIVLAALRPWLVVDARLRRGVPPEVQRGEAPLVIGLGPDLCAGTHVDVVIETCPGPTLGQVVRVGTALPYRPLPPPRDPARAEQFVRAPAAGLWRTARVLGEVVPAGAVLGTVGDAVVHAPVAGCLRGLVHDAVPVAARAKIAAVHPGDWARKEAGISQRAAAVAASVLALVGAAAAGAAAPVLGVG